MHVFLSKCAEFFCRKHIADVLFLFEQKTDLFSLITIYQSLHAHVLKPLKRLGALRRFELREDWSYGIIEDDH